MSPPCDHSLLGNSPTFLTSSFASSFAFATIATLSSAFPAALALITAFATFATGLPTALSLVQGTEETGCTLSIIISDFIINESKLSGCRWQLFFIRERGTGSGCKTSWPSSASRILLDGFTDFECLLCLTSLRDLRETSPAVIVFPTPHTIIRHTAPPCWKAATPILRPLLESVVGPHSGLASKCSCAGGLKEGCLPIALLLLACPLCHANQPHLEMKTSSERLLRTQVGMTAESIL